MCPTWQNPWADGLNMIASRGMGAILPSKMPKAKKATRKDGDKFTKFCGGGKAKMPKGIK